MPAVGSLSVSPRERTDNAFSRRAGHASISALDVRTGRLQWGTAVHWREHHEIEYKLEASLRQMRPRRLGGCRFTRGSLTSPLRPSDLMTLILEARPFARLLKASLSIDRRYGFTTMTSVLTELAMKQFS